MMFYEKDELNIPKRYKNMTREQLRKEGKVLEKLAIIVAKLTSFRKKKSSNDLKVKFYI